MDAQTCPPVLGFSIAPYLPLETPRAKRRSPNNPTTCAYLAATVPLRRQKARFVTYWSSPLALSRAAGSWDVMQLGRTESTESPTAYPVFQCLMGSRSPLSILYGIWHRGSFTLSCRILFPSPLSSSRIEDNRLSPTLFIMAGSRTSYW